MYGTVKSVPRQQAHDFVYHKGCNLKKLKVGLLISEKIKAVCDPESSCGRFLFSVGVKTERNRRMFLRNTKKSTKDIDDNVLHIMLIVFKAFAHHLASFWVFLVADFFLFVEHYLLYDGL